MSFRPLCNFIVFEYVPDYTKGLCHVSTKWFDVESDSKFIEIIFESKFGVTAYFDIFWNVNPILSKRIFIIIHGRNFQYKRCER